MSMRLEGSVHFLPFLLRSFHNQQYQYLSLQLNKMSIANPAKSSSSLVKIAPGAVVCKDSELRGDIFIGNRTVIHPKAAIIAESGPIVIGESNLIEEQVRIINSSPDPKDATPMVIGSNNVFEVGSQSESLKIGDNNILEAKAHVGRSTELSSGCVIGATCHVVTQEVLPENTVIFGEKYERRLQAEHPAAQTLQLDFLTKILPNYHHLKKNKKDHSNK